MVSTLHSLFLTVAGGGWATGAWIPFLLSAALKGSLLIGLLFLACRALRSASASTRHLVWTLGMSGLLLLPAAEVGMPSWRVLPVPHSFLPIESALIHGGGSVASLPLDPRESGGPSESVVLDGDGSAAANIRLQAAGGQRDPLMAGSPPTPAAWCALLWLAGVLAVLIKVGWGTRRLGCLRREARPLEDGEWRLLLRTVCRDLGLSSEPLLLLSPAASVPMTWGLRRPVVLLPRDCQEWPEELRRQALVHELAHIKRRDCLTQLIARGACLLYWFHPLVWLAARRMRIERERACDDVVLSEGALPSDYAEHLLRLARRPGAGEPVPTGSLAMARPSQIYERLEALLDSRRRRGRAGRAAAAGLAGITLVCMAGLSALEPAALAHQGDSLRMSADGDSAPSSSSGIPSLPSPADLIGPGLALFSSGRPRSCEYQMDGVTVKLEMEGGIEFKEGHTGIVRMDPNASFEIEEKRGRRRTSLTASPGAGGSPVYNFRIGHQARPFDAGGAAWLERALEFICLQAGLDADVRVLRAYEKDGIRGVWPLIDQVDSPTAQSIYYCEFLSLDGLKDQEIEEALRRSGRRLDSDYLRASVLIEYVSRHLQRPETWDTFLETFSSLRSSWEMRRVLQTGLESGQRTPDELGLLLGAVAEMSSDHEASEFLSAFNPELLTAAKTHRAYFAALDGLRSDHEKAEVLISLARKSRGDAGMQEACFEAAQNLGSQFEFSRVARALR